MSGFELPVLFAAGSAAASAAKPYCKQLAEKVKEFVLKRAGEEVDERVFRKDEKAEFLSGLEDLAVLLESVARNPAVDDPSVRDMLDGLGKSIQVAADAKYTNEREAARNVINDRKTNLMLALLNVASARVLTSVGRDGQGEIETPYTYASSKEASYIGRGTFASVYTMRKKGDEQLFAVKLTQIDGTITLEKLQEEAVRLRALEHPNIVQYWDAFYPFKDDHDYFAIVMEHLTGGSLQDRLEKATDPLTRDEAPGTAKWARQVASALAHMHAQRMQHRDLKPDNVLFNGAGDAKVIDLGLAVVIKIKLRQSSVGAPLYSSPEKATEKRSYDAKDDVWALGCMLAAAVTGTTLEARHDKGGVSLSKSRKNVDRLVRESKAVSREFGPLVAAMLKWNSKERPTAASLEESLESLEKSLEKPLSADDVTVEGTRDTSTKSMLKRCFGCRIFGCGMKRSDLSKLALVRTLKGHSRAVKCVAVIPRRCCVSGQRVVSGSSDNTLKVWDVATGRCVATLEGHSWAVNCVAVFPDGRRVVSASDDGTLKVWDVAAGKCVATLKGHSSVVFCVAVFPEGWRVVSASCDETLKVWDVATGECVATLEGHSHAVMSVAISPDGWRVVSASFDNTLKVWNVATGECVATLRGHLSHVLSVAVFPDGRRVVSASGSTLKVWEVKNGKWECVATLQGHSYDVYGVAVFPDGRHVVSGGNYSELKGWDISTGKCVATLEGHSKAVNGVAVLPDGRRVVSASDDGTLKLYAC